MGRSVRQWFRQVQAAVGGVIPYVLYFWVLGITILAPVCLLSGIRSRSPYMFRDLPIYRIQPILGIFSLGCERSMRGAGAVHKLALLLVSLGASLSGPPGAVRGTPRGDAAPQEPRGAARGAAGHPRVASFRPAGPAFRPG